MTGATLDRVAFAIFLIAILIAGVAVVIRAK